MRSSRRSWPVAPRSANIDRRQPAPGCRERPPLNREPTRLAPHDPELDPPPQRPARPLPAHTVLVPQEYQRLVANPFLALALLVAWFAAMRVAIGARNIVAALVCGASFIVVVRMLHYHCRDCGRTGWLFRWRAHACEAVVARQLSGRIRRWRGPTPPIQAVLWMYLIALILFAALVTRALRLF